MMKAVVKAKAEPGLWLEEVPVPTVGGDDVLIGGSGTMWGALLGAFVLRWLPEFLRPVQQYETVVYSFLLLATIVLLPHGILGGVSRLFRKVVGRRVRG